MMFIVYFVGQYWYIFVQISCLFSNPDHLEKGHDFVMADSLSVYQ
jgi:hypothetical protein